MNNPLANLKSRFFRPTELPAGSVFRLGATNAVPAEDCVWRVCKIRDLRGLPHALIEHATTGLTKTVAVSALLADRTFQVLPQNA